MLILSFAKKYFALLYAFTANLSSAYEAFAAHTVVQFRMNSMQIDLSPPSTYWNKKCLCLLRISTTTTTNNSQHTKSQNKAKQRKKKNDNMCKFFAITSHVFFESSVKRSKTPTMNVHCMKSIIIGTLVVAVNICALTRYNCEWIESGLNWMWFVSSFIHWPYAQIYDLIAQTAVNSHTIVVIPLIM